MISTNFRCSSQPFTSNLHIFHHFPCSSWVRCRPSRPGTRSAGVVRTGPARPGPRWCRTRRWRRPRPGPRSRHLEAARLGMDWGQGPDTQRHAKIGDVDRWSRLIDWKLGIWKYLINMDECYSCIVYDLSKQIKLIRYGTNDSNNNIAIYIYTYVNINIYIYMLVRHIWPVGCNFTYKPFK